jgi:hypothetical protein
MRTMGKLALLAGAAAGVTAARRVSGTTQQGDDENRWLAVTVNRPFDEIDRADLPGPLGELGDRVEVRVQPASGDKGTELTARLREPGPSGVAARLAGQDPRQEVRVALRAAKSLLETGDVLRPEPSATHPGPGGKLVQLASRRAGGEGRL